MELKDVQDFIKTNAGKPEVQEYIKGFITPDSVKAFNDSEAGQKILQPKLDQYMTKGLETWKTNNLQGIVDGKVNEYVLANHPKETEEQKRLHTLETNLAEETKKRIKAEMLMSATSEATAKGLPPELVKYFVGNDSDSTKAALLDLETAVAGIKKSSVDAVFKQNGRTPETNPDKTAGLFSVEDVKKMSPKEEMANHSKVLESMQYWKK